MFRVTKTYGHNLGLSTTFRQWRATSHCKYLHGYALEVKLVFAAPCLNKNNWVIDFGSLKPVKKWLEETFDHKTLVAEDDPLRHTLFDDSADQGLMDLVICPATGCEGFAKFIADKVNDILFNDPTTQLQGGADNGVYLESVEVREHGANSAIYHPPIRSTTDLKKSCEPETGVVERTVTETVDNVQSTQYSVLCPATIDGKHDFEIYAIHGAKNEFKCRNCGAILQTRFI